MAGCEAGIKKVCMEIASMKKAIAYLLIVTLIVCCVPAAYAGSDYQPVLDSLYPRTFFGHYEQDGTITDGPEPIEWYVLDNLDGDCLLISKYIIDAMAFNARDTDLFSGNNSQKEVTWESCSLRNWLNGEFYEMAFSGAEKDAIDGTLNHGQRIHDSFFLFDSEELDKYLPEYQERIALPTQNAINSKLGISPVNGAGGWWIRSPAKTVGNAANISAVGFTGEYLAANVTFGVRPCVWVAGDLLEIISGDEGSSEESSESSFDEIGSSVVFGHYEQDGDLANGQEAIQWIVLDSHDGRSLLLSKYLLDYQPYNTLTTFVQWSTSSIRSWLNEKFLFTAFSDAELQSIVRVQIHDDSDEISDLYTFTDNEDTDYLFLLNRNEAKEYFESHRARQVRVTTVIDLLNGINQKRKELRDIMDGAKKINRDPENSDFDAWWLRDNTNMSTYAPAVKENGEIYPTNMIKDKSGIRPAFWIDLNSLPVS